MRLPPALLGLLAAILAFFTLFLLLQALGTPGAAELLLALILSAAVGWVVSRRSRASPSR